MTPNEHKITFTVDADLVAKTEGNPMTDDRLTVEEVEALIRLAEYERQQQRRHVRRRRLRKAAIIASSPITTVMAGVWWDEQERKGWR